jgi:hypothetical protein
MLERAQARDAEGRLGILGRMDAADAWPPPDPLGEAPHFLRMDGAFYCRSERSAPWRMTLQAMPGHLPQGHGHCLRSEPGVPAPGVMELEMEHPGDRNELAPARDGQCGGRFCMVMS